MEAVKFDQSLYNDDFFAWHDKYARQYSLKTMDWYVDTYRPQSVCDFGCGIGSYIESAYLKGIEKCKGYDIGGDYARKYTPEYIQRFIEYRDCTDPIYEDQYDCVISFETAEHIDPAGSGRFVQNIVSACKQNRLILFTAAPPGQEGCGHINCQPKDFWISLFRGLGAVPHDSHTRYVAKAWGGLGCPGYIKNNLIIFIKL